MEDSGKEKAWDVSARKEVWFSTPRRMDWWTTTSRICWRIGKDACGFATWGGLSCLEGGRFRSYTVADGLPNCHVRCLYEDEDGILWLGTDNGVVLFDGQVFQTIRAPDLVAVNQICQDAEGRYWFATLNGLIGYRRYRMPPRVCVVQVLADRVYEGEEKVEVPASTRQVVFEFKGMSFRTSPQDMLYTCRLQGHENEWRPVSREQRAFYRDLSPGTYTFQVRTIGRDLNASEPASMEGLRKCWGCRRWRCTAG
jgi:hypothetical protein